jgi:hypothetical protein
LFGKRILCDRAGANSDASEPAKAKFTPNPSKPIKARAKPPPNFSKEKALFSLDFLVRNEPFQGVALTPQAKSLFTPILQKAYADPVLSRRTSNIRPRFSGALSFAPAFTTIGILARASIFRKRLFRDGSLRVRYSSEKTMLSEQNLKQKIEVGAGQWRPRWPWLRQAAPP